MDTKTAVAIYAASLSTLTALVGLVRMRRDRPFVEVNASLAFIPVSDEESVRGAVVEIHEPGNLFECSIELQIVNRGRRAVQIAGVIVEGIDDFDADRIVGAEVRPEPLPGVLEPLTSVETRIQKEHIDMLPIVLFLGAVDALGNRHAAHDEDIRRIIERNQELPSAIGVFQRRDDPSTRVISFQAKNPFRTISRPSQTRRWRLGSGWRLRRRVERRGWSHPASPDAEVKRRQMLAPRDGVEEAG